MIRINLRGRDAATPRRSWSMPDISLGSADQTVFGLVVLGVMVVLVAGWWYQAGQVDSMQDRLREVQQQHRRLQETAETVDEMEERTAMLRQKLEVIVELKRNQTGPVLLLDEISQRLSDGLWLTQLESREGAVNIVGAALSNTSIADFHANLQRSPYFEDVVLLFTEDTGEAVQFNITCEFSPGGDSVAGTDGEGAGTTARADDADAGTQASRLARAG